MSIYFSQHGKSASKSEDPERRLTADGAAEVERVARFMAESGCAVGIIWHSGKVRAAQSAEIFAAALNPAGGVRTRDGIEPLDDVTALAAHLDEDRNEMFVCAATLMRTRAGARFTGIARNSCPTVSG